VSYVLTREEFFGSVVLKSYRMIIDTETKRYTTTNIYSRPVELEPPWQDARSGDAPPPPRLDLAPRDALKCYRLLSSRDDDFSPANQEDVIRGLHPAKGVWSFECLWKAGEAITQYVIPERFFPHLEAPLKGRMRQSTLQAAADPLGQHLVEKRELLESGELMLAFVEPFPDCLYHMPLTPVEEFGAPPLNILLEAYKENLGDGELGAYQVLIQPCRNEHDWGGNISALYDVEFLAGQTMFPRPYNPLVPQQGPSVYLPNRAERLGIKNHPDKKFFACRVRVGGLFRRDNVATVIKGCLSFLSQFQCGGRPLGVMRALDYEKALGLGPVREMVLRRTSHSTGMILNSHELLGFTMLPVSATAVEKDTVEAGVLGRLEVPEELRTGDYLFGYCPQGDERVPVMVPRVDVRYASSGIPLANGHIVVIGQTGSGKSTLIGELVRQDMDRRDCSVVLSSPHPDIFKDVGGHITEEDLDRTVNVEATEGDQVVGLDILQTGDQRNLGRAAEDATNCMRGALEVWGARMAHIFRNIFLAIFALKLPFDAARVLLDKHYDAQGSDIVREYVVDALKRRGYQEAVYFWKGDFGRLYMDELFPVLNKFSLVVLNKATANAFSLRKSTLTFREVIMRNMVCFLNNRVDVLGYEAATFLTDFQVMSLKNNALGLMRLPREKRPKCRCYIEEAQRLVGPGIPQMMEETRKSNTDAIPSYANLSELDPRALAAVQAAGVMALFKVSAADFRKVHDRFQPWVTEQDVARLQRGQGYVSAGGRVAYFETVVPEPGRPELIDLITRLSLERYGVQAAEPTTPRSLISPEALAARKEAPKQSGRRPRHRPKLF